MFYLKVYSFYLTKNTISWNLQYCCPSSLSLIYLINYKKMNRNCKFININDPGKFFVYFNSEIIFF